jgi:GT2 family glycosyltransferase
MQPRVTAILVARNGAKHLERTLEALKSQTRPPDIVVTVDCGSTDATADMLAAFGPTKFISADADLTFGQAINAAVRVIAQPQDDNEMLWLLAQDAAPEPTALAVLLGELEIAPSVAVAGPKIMEWDASDYIHEFGQSITPFGATVTLVESELDQGQHDDLSDVLAVSAAGMLVRHTVWEQLGGFDPALPVVDDSLDFCIRVRLAGYRVSVVPSARVTSAGDGVAGLNGSSRGTWRRRRLRVIRTAQLHRRMVYAPTAALAFHWLSLVPLAILRSIWQLLRKEPGAILGEFAAALAVAFNGMRVGAARKQFAATRQLGWGSIASLRITAAEVRRRQALRRESSLAGIRGARPEIRFFSGGGAWTLLAAAVLGVGILAPLLGAQTLSGGGLLPLDDSPGELWQSMLYGWRDTGLGFVGAADPFAAVLAVLGSLTFWAPSFALVLLYFAALPLAAFGAWMAATRLTDRGGLRAIVAVLWVLAPPFLSAVAAGRPSAVLVHLLLPWLFFAGYSAARSWSASASAALLFAAVVACAPSLAPALVVGWLICVIVSGRSIMRFIGIPLPALALAAPLIIDQGIRGNWLALLADPGAPVFDPPASFWQLLLGFPTGELGGWAPILADHGLPAVTGQLIVPILLALVAVPALVSLFLPGARSAAFALAAALLGVGTAVAATHLFVSSVGSQATSIWAGSGLSLYWMGIVGAALFTFRNARSYALVPAIAAAIGVLIVVAPLAASMTLGTSVVAKGGVRTLPAFVTAEAATSSRVGTLEIVPQPDGGILATIVRGAGVTLNDQSTLASTSTRLSTDDKDLATLAGNLVSRSGLDATDQLTKFGIRFVVLRPADVVATGPGTAAPVSPDAADTTLRATTALDGNAALAPVGDTEFGRLWQHEATADAAAAGRVPPNAGEPFRLVSLIALIVVFGATVLLSIPTGANREAVRQANREAIRRAAREKKRAARAVAAVAAPTGAAPVEAAPVEPAVPEEPASPVEPVPDTAISDADAPAGDPASAGSIGTDGTDGTDGADTNDDIKDETNAH